MQYPESVLFQSIDAEHIAEELIKIFAQVSLTDQDSNITSKLLSEFYQSLRVQAVHTSCSPYHPQCWLVT